MSSFRMSPTMPITVRQASGERVVPETQARPKRQFLSPVTSGGGFADHHDERSPGSVGRAEQSARAQRNTERLEIARGDADVIHGARLTVENRLPFDLDGATGLR